MTFCLIAVGEGLYCLAGKCLCAAFKQKTTSFFEPYQFGVASPHKAERIIMVRACVEECRTDDESGYEEHL